MIENNIEFLRGDRQATVTFSQGRFITKIKKLAEIYPDECRIVDENQDGSIVAHIPVTWVKVSPPRQVSEKQREDARERMNNYHSNMYPLHKK